MAIILRLWNSLANRGPVRMEAMESVGRFGPGQERHDGPLGRIIDVPRAQKRSLPTQRASWNYQEREERRSEQANKFDGYQRTGNLAHTHTDINATQEGALLFD